ncbi:MAG TPA: DUF1990 domain-containing protein [Rubrobacteraceae bacterium]|nr:DUF1990 domain-containing protein [Rubrobacteraceae bacterium]
MFLFREPPDVAVRRFVAGQRGLPFSYSEVGATRGGATAGYVADRYRVRLGEGEETFERAVAALRSWSMFDLGWACLIPDDAPIERGVTVAVLARHLGLWSLNAARIVYVVEDSGSVERRGFAYGTLPGHAARGEERFCVEWDRASDSVHYDVLAFSRPGHPLAWLGYPFVRRLQRRFARDSSAAMLAAARGGP